MWLIVAILGYFFLAISFLGDKFLLTGGISNPKVYTFYVGILSIFVVIFIPFGFFFPSQLQIILAFLTGSIFILGLYIYYSLVKKFEVSRIVPSIGGLIPILTFLFIYALSSGTVKLSFLNIINFLLLISGSVLIIAEKIKDIFNRTFIFSLGAAFYFALYFVLAKSVYTSLGFINGFIWIRLGSFLAALILLFSREVRGKVFFSTRQKGIKTTGLFIGNQIAGSLGGILQNWAVALAPLIFVAFVNALAGVQYVFLTLFTILLSVKFPKILKEEFSKKIVFQKILAIIIIGAGLTLLAFN